MRILTSATYLRPLPAPGPWKVHAQIHLIERGWYPQVVCFLILVQAQHVVVQLQVFRIFDISVILAIFSCNIIRSFSKFSHVTSNHQIHSPTSEIQSFGEISLPIWFQESNFIPSLNPWRLKAPNFRNLVNSPVEVGSWCQYLSGFFTSQVVVWDVWTMNSMTMTMILWSTLKSRCRRFLGLLWIPPSPLASANDTRMGPGSNESVHICNHMQIIPIGSMHSIFTYI